MKNKEEIIAPTTFIVRVIKKERWETGFIDADLSWDVPFKNFAVVIDYLSQFELRPKRKKRPSPNYPKTNK